jgi:hypothetical protein
MAELRCDNKKHGEVIDDHTVEVLCNSQFCKLSPDEVVLHRFDLLTGAHTTHRYAKPRKAQ